MAEYSCNENGRVMARMKAEDLMQAGARKAEWFCRVDKPDQPYEVWADVELVTDFYK
jgi:hypothetical protein